MNDKQKRLLSAVLRIASSELEKGCPNVSGEELDTVIDTLNTLFSPSKEKPIGMYGLRQMFGVTRETIQRKIAEGIIPRGFQIAGEGHKSFWFKSDIKKAQAR